MALQLLREKDERVRPPHSLLVPLRHGYPLREPGSRAAQREVLETALRLLEDERLHPPALVELEEE